MFWKPLGEGWGVYGSFWGWRMCLYDRIHSVGSKYIKPTPIYRVGVGNPGVFCPLVSCFIGRKVRLLVEGHSSRPRHGLHKHTPETFPPAWNILPPGGLIWDLSEDIEIQWRRANSLFYIWRQAGVFTSAYIPISYDGNRAAGIFKAHGFASDEYQVSTPLKTLEEMCVCIINSGR